MTPRVLVVAEQLRRRVPGGIGRYAGSLLSALVAPADQAGRPAGAGDDLAILASRSPGGAGADPLDRFGLPVRTSPLPGALLTRGWDLGLVHAPGGFDVLHATSLAAPPVRRRGGEALVVTVHDLAWRAFPEATTRRGRRWHEAALARALTRANRLVAPSREVAHELTGAGARPGSVEVVTWGADHLPPPDRAAADHLLEHLGVAGPFLLSVGTLEPRKNLARLLAAYAEARSRLPGPWPLVVVGPRGWGPGAAVASGQPGNGEQRAPTGVVFAGEVEDPVLAGLYERARVFAYVPLAEGYGLPPTEAMGFGVPVVAGNSVPSVVAPPGSPSPALLVDPGSPPAIADALVAAATDRALRDELAARGRALASARTWRAAAEAHRELWGSLR